MMDTEGNIYSIPLNQDFNKLLQEKFVTQLSEEEKQLMEKTKQEERYPRLVENRAMRRERQRQERREARRLYRKSRG